MVSETDIALEKGLFKSKNSNFVHKAESRARVCPDLNDQSKKACVDAVLYLFS